MRKLRHREVKCQAQGIILYAPQLRVRATSYLPSYAWAKDVVGPPDVGEKGRSRFHCPRGDEFGLACFRFHDLHCGAALPGMGPFHWKQHPVWEHAKPSCIQQSPLENAPAQANQKQCQWRCKRQPGPHRPRSWEWGADGGWRRHPIVPTRPVPGSVHWESENRLEQRPSERVEALRGSCS